MQHTHARWQRRAVTQRAPDETWAQCALIVLCALTALSFMTGCGGDAITVSEPLELETAEEPLLSDDNFGVQTISLNQCNPGSTVPCYYPPGFGDGNYQDGIPWQWRVCFDLPTMTADQASKVAVAFAHVRDSLQAGGADIIGVPCNGTENIRVYKTNTGGAADRISGYMFPTCPVHTLLDEQPLISTSHRYCEKWDVGIGMDRIDANFSASIEPHIYKHALGATLGAAAIGSGQHTASGWSSYWSYSPTSPIGKSGFVSNDYCRARARYDANGQYTQITKTDNACD